MIRLRLREFLENHNISAYRLGLEVPELDAQTIYHYVRGSRTPSLKGLDAVIRGLRTLTGKTVEVSDLLQYLDDTDLANIPEEERQSWTLISNGNNSSQSSKATIHPPLARARDRRRQRKSATHRLRRLIRQSALYLRASLLRVRTR